MCVDDPERLLHVAEVKVRLVPDDAALLRALARRGDMPPAVLARVMLRRELHRVSQHGAAVGNTEGPVRAGRQ